MRAEIRRRGRILTADRIAVAKEIRAVIIEQLRAQDVALPPAVRAAQELELPSDFVPLYERLRYPFVLDAMAIWPIARLYLFGFHGLSLAFARIWVALDNRIAAEQAALRRLSDGIARCARGKMSGNALNAAGARLLAASQAADKALEDLKRLVETIRIVLDAHGWPDPIEADGSKETDV